MEVDRRFINDGEPFDIEHLVGINDHERVTLDPSSKETVFMITERRLSCDACAIIGFRNGVEEWVLTHYDQILLHKHVSALRQKAYDRVQVAFLCFAYFADPQVFEQQYSFIETVDIMEGLPH